MAEHTASETHDECALASNDGEDAPDATGAVRARISATFPRASRYSEIQASTRTSAELLQWVVADLAHNFNNLLTTVLCNISMANTELPAESSALSPLKDAAAAVNQAATVTRQLHEVARRQQCTREFARIDQLIERAYPALALLVGQQSPLRVTHTGDPGVIEVDARQFEVVLGQLVHNACDAVAFRGSVMIATETLTITQKYLASRPSLSPGAYVAMRVVDTGVGIPRDVCERIFEPFFTTKPRHLNSGLGLAACSAIIRQCGGAIEVNSRVGVGTTVTVYWPRVSEPGLFQLPSEEHPIPENKTATILLVEDESALRTITARILKRLGFQVLCAASGLEALDIASKFEGRIDVLFTDVVMPGMNGRELSDQLRCVRPDMKVLLTSGYTEQIFSDGTPRAENAECVEGEKVRYLNKPYQPDVLIGYIEELLGSNPL
jgi:signal transduction histidine kinase/CheY-like chemotaxis protein